MNPTPSRLEGLRIERSTKPASPARLGSLVIVAVVLAVVGSVVWWFSHPKPIEVRTALAREITASGADHTVLNGSGYVTARREATVSSKVTGKVVEVLIEEGMKVSEGQILARLDDTNTKASLLLAHAQWESAKSALAETQVRLKEAEQDRARASQLLKANSSTQADYDHADAAARALGAHLAQQQADVGVAERTVAIWEQQIEDTVIRAPFASVVTSKNAQPGEMISPISAGGGFTRTGICTLVDMDSLEIEIDVNESYINRVAAGQPAEATLDAYPDWKLPCHVIAIIPSADRNKSTVKVRVGFDKLDPRILPDMSVKVAFQETASASTEPPRGVLVSKQAIRDQNGRDVVWVVREGRAEHRAVAVRPAGGDDALIAAGLAAGERVIVEGPNNLTDGSSVNEANP